MSRALARSYPFLLALIPVLHMVAANPGQATLDDLFVALAVVLVGCALVYALAAVASRGRWARGLPALVLLAVVLWFWGYIPVLDLVGRRSSFVTHALVFPIALVATVGAGRWLLRR